MKRWWQRQSTIGKYCIATLLTGMGLILFWALLSSFDDLWKSFVHLLRTVGVLLVPFLAALLISYALSPAVNALERGLNRISRGRLGKARVLAVTLLYAAILGLCFWVAADFVPKLLAIGIVLVVTGSSMLQTLKDFMIQIFQMIQQG